MNRIILLLILIFSFAEIMCLSYTDADFCVKKELWSILDKHADAVRDSALAEASSAKWLNLYLSYADYKADTLMVLQCLQKLALEHNDLESAVNWVSIAPVYADVHKDYTLEPVSTQLPAHYSDEADQLLLQSLLTNPSEDSLYAAIGKLTHYNSYIEELAKTVVDMISVESDDSLSFALIQKFSQTFPYSKWSQAVYYFELAHYMNKGDYAAAFAVMDEKGKLSPAHRYLTTLYLVSPTLRRELQHTDLQQDWWSKALDLIDFIPVQTDTELVLYDSYSPAHWQARLTLQKAKIMYYRLIAPYGYFGDEDRLIAVLKMPIPDWQKINLMLSGINFDTNDAGEQAELAFWKGRLYALLSDKKSRLQALNYFTDCLILGAPRQKYDKDAITYSEHLLKTLKIKTDLIAWQRKQRKYQSIIFNDITTSAGLKDNRETRVAIGDYDNDGYPDLLLNGNRLYKNNRNLTFSDVSEAAGLTKLNANGGLFADFNLDGKLDLMTTSNSAEGNGEALMKNDGNRFIKVNERAGEIDDTFPTEGAAWIDCFQDRYPDLYCANYEIWNERSGFEDRFWNNAGGYFTNKTKDYGFLNPPYTHDPGQAGRGVAPADFDNDGIQEIYVTNYRLDRNFLWDRQDTIFVDTAALNSVQGILKKGYYGHSIGADWGDFDNDGDLDLFVANLAHPRYLDISDISMLLRNDGKRERIVEGDTIRYYQFTDVTKQAGITYDELHSDPLWFDADNDGFLDLFITSVYEHDRSYLYHNNGNGTFTDITWLAGARIYNGWGNAAGDFDRDGKLDLAIGSGNHTKILHNVTPSSHKALFLKPVHSDGKIVLEENWRKYSELPNSPAYGTRVLVTLKDKNNREFQLMRELSSAKGTTSQNDQVLHFGLGENKVVNYKIFAPAKAMQ